MKLTLKNTIIEQALSLEDAQIDKPFEKFPDYQVLRRKSNGKWFGLLMTVNKNKLGLSGDDTVEVIDLKANPEIVSILSKGEGYFPAYHMNKNHWITVLLDGTV